LLKVVNEIKESRRLLSRPIVLRSTIRLRSATHPAYTDRIGIVTLNMGARLVKWATVFDRAVSANDEMVPNIRPTSFIYVPFSNFFCADVHILVRG